MFRVDITNHMVWAVQGVREGILVGRLMQTFNHSWKKNRMIMNVLILKQKLVMSS